LVNTQTPSTAGGTVAFRATVNSARAGRSADIAAGDSGNWKASMCGFGPSGTFETEMLAEEENFAGLTRINRELIGKAEALDSPQRAVLDMDSTEIPVYGQQENSAYNGHFESTCFHPLVLFNREGDCLAAKLRPGNVHSADDWEELLLPEIERQQQQGKKWSYGPTPPLPTRRSTRRLNRGV
jgi:Transposase DDE domain group 1